jgi:hypothetical protein
MTVIYTDKISKGSAYMATQIAPTPILTGKSAKKILELMKIKPSIETNKGIQNIFNMFKDKESI